MLRKSVKKPRPSVADKLFWIVFSRYVNGWRNNTVVTFPGFPNLSIRILGNRSTSMGLIAETVAAIK
jgi:hypothetical protein